MNITCVKTVTVTIAILVLVGCSGGDSEVSTVINESDSPSSSSKRVKTISYDFEQDGITNLVWTYEYDSSGRVVSRTEDDKFDPQDSLTVNYEYGNDGLVRKYTDSGAQDVHTYQNGLLVVSNRHWDGEHTYTYDSENRLIGTTGDDFFVSDDDCDDFGQPFDETSQTAASYVMSYSGNKLDTVASSDGLSLLTFTYNDKQLLEGLVESVSCSGEEVLEVTKYRFLYDEADQLVRVENYIEDLTFQTIMDFETIVISRNADGKMVSIVETDASNRKTTIERTYGIDGLPSSDRVFVTGSSNTFFSTPNQTITYTYEDETCQIFNSSNPAKLLMLDSFTTHSNDPGALKCGFKLDEAEL